MDVTIDAQKSLLPYVLVIQQLSIACVYLCISILTSALGMVIILKK